MVEGSTLTTDGPIVGMKEAAGGGSYHLVVNDFPSQRQHDRQNGEHQVGYARDLATARRSLGLRLVGGQEFQYRAADLPARRSS